MLTDFQICISVPLNTPVELPSLTIVLSHIDQNFFLLVFNCASFLKRNIFVFLYLNLYPTVTSTLKHLVTFL